jgi:hypothetical protein
MATRGSLLLEATHPLFVVAREPAQLLVLPRRVAVEPPSEARLAA